MNEEEVRAALQWISEYFDDYGEEFWDELFAGEDREKILADRREVHFNKDKPGIGLRLKGESICLINRRGLIVGRVQATEDDRELYVKSVLFNKYLRQLDHQ